MESIQEKVEDLCTVFVDIQIQSRFGKRNQFDQEHEVRNVPLHKFKILNILPLDQNLSCLKSRTKSKFKITA